MDEGFVGTAGGFDQANRWLVDLFDGLVQRLVFAAHQRDFAVDVQDAAEEGFFLPFQGDRDAAHGDVALAGEHVGHQGFPGGGHPLDLDAKAVGQGAGHGDVDAGVFAVLGFEGVGLVVAGGANAQLSLLHDAVQMRRFCLGAKGECEQAAEHHCSFDFRHCYRAFVLEWF
ncbi:hypothetical protein D3C71_769650 [compost metagenome]